MILRKPGQASSHPSVTGATARRPPRRTRFGEWLALWLQLAAVMTPAAFCLQSILLYALSPWFGRDYAPSGGLLWIQVIAFGMVCPAFAIWVSAGEERKRLQSLPCRDERSGEIRITRRGEGESSVSVRAPSLAGAPLAGADLRWANLWGAELAGANLRGADLRSACLADINLAGADLREADLRGALLQRADLKGADLTGADLRGAAVRAADLSGARYDPSTRWPWLYRPERHGLVRW